jgi:prepilin-type N-terminal cleavage/methylation domain-containing protein
MGKQTTTRDSGFTLIELLIVIAIIGILASVSFVAYKGSVRKANEASAVAALNSIKVAQSNYVIDHKGEYGTFKQLFEEGYLDKRFNQDEPNISGYIFKLNLRAKSETQAPGFSVNADPQFSEGVQATGRNFYYIDAESGITVSKKGPATAEDEML